MRGGGQRFNYVARGGSSVSEGGGDNTVLILLSVFILAIIIGSIGYGSMYYRRRENFADAPSPKYTLQYYCMPNCGYCKDFDPTWERLVSEVATKQSEYNFTTVKYMITDNGEGKASAAKYNITSTPTVLLVKKDSPNTYFVFNDSRDFNTLKTFANKNAV